MALNELLILERLRAWAKNQPAPPAKLFLQLTERCNLSCPSCHVSDGPGTPKEKEISEAEWLAVIDEAAALGVREVYLVGGEIFVRRDTALHLMERIKALGLVGDTTTNGVLINDEMVERIVLAGWDNLTFSIDAPETAINDRLRSKDGTLARITRTILRFSEVKARLGMSRPRITINMVVGAESAPHLAAMVDYAAALHVPVVIAQPMSPLSTRAPSMMLRAENHAALVEWATDAAEKADRAGIVHNLRTLTDPRVVYNTGTMDAVIERDVKGVAHPFYRSGCFVPFTQLVVFMDGVVTTCWMHRGMSHSRAGDHALGDIWHGREFNTVRAGLLTGEMPSYCKNCCVAYIEDNRRWRMDGLEQAQSWRDIIVASANILASDPGTTRFAKAQLRALFAMGSTDEAVKYALAFFEGAKAGAPPEVRWAMLDELVLRGEKQAAVQAAALQLAALADELDDAAQAEFERLLGFVAGLVLAEGALHGAMFREGVRAALAAQPLLDALLPVAAARPMLVALALAEPLPGVGEGESDDGLGADFESGVEEPDGLRALLRPRTGESGPVDLATRWNVVLLSKRARADKLIAFEQLCAAGLLREGLKMPAEHGKLWFTKSLALAHFLLARHLERAPGQSDEPTFVTVQRLSVQLHAMSPGHAGVVGLLTLSQYYAGDRLGARKTLSRFAQGKPSETDVLWLRSALQYGRNARALTTVQRVHAMMALGEWRAAEDIFCKLMIVGAPWRLYLEAWESLGLDGLRELTRRCLAGLSQPAVGRVRDPADVGRFREGMEELARAVAQAGHRGPATEIRYWLALTPGGQPVHAAA